MLSPMNRAASSPFAACLCRHRLVLVSIYAGNTALLTCQLACSCYVLSSPYCTLSRNVSDASSLALNIEVVSASFRIRSDIECNHLAGSFAFVR
jgi:hypothetical protein